MPCCAEGNIIFTILGNIPASAGGKRLFSDGNRRDATVRKLQKGSWKCTEHQMHFISSGLQLVSLFTCKIGRPMVHIPFLCLRSHVSNDFSDLRLTVCIQCMS